MVAVDHLLYSFKAVFENLPPSVSDERKISLNCDLEQAESLSEAVRRQIAFPVSPFTPHAGSNDSDCGDNKQSASCFCWSDGVLVKALERGDWVVLDGANLCSARYIFV